MLPLPPPLPPPPPPEPPPGVLDGGEDVPEEAAEDWGGGVLDGGGWDCEGSGAAVLAGGSSPPLDCAAAHDVKASKLRTLAILIVDVMRWPLWENSC